jgi:Cytochrome c554 and c-prime
MPTDDREWWKTIFHVVPQLGNSSRPTSCRDRATVRGKSIVTRPLLAAMPRIAAACLAAAVGLSEIAAVRAADPRLDNSHRPSDLVGSLSCSSVSCHGQLEPPAVAENAFGQAYHLWLRGDPHARAGLRLLEPRFLEVLRRASHHSDGTTDPRVQAECAKCHDPLGSREVDSPTPTLSLTNSEPAIGHGIGCESCHGAAGRWITRHFERGLSRDELRGLGLVDTKNVLVRARLCVSCHVGSAENNLTHDMLAAGHPPLRFEMASYQALIARKHWDDGPRRQKEPDHEVQLWGAGRLASAEAALNVLEGRAKRAAAEATQIGNDGSRATWPELAEYECFACHQPLRPEVGRSSLESLTGRVSGMPPWRRWNVSCVPGGPDFATDLARIRGEMERSLLPPPETVARLAAESRAALEREIGLTESGRVLVAGVPLEISSALGALAMRHEADTWEDACHELAALAAIEHSSRPAAHSPAAFRERLARVAGSLSFVRPDSEWPATLARSRSDKTPAGDTMSLAEIRQALNDALRELAGP